MTILRRLSGLKARHNAEKQMPNEQRCKTCTYWRPLNKNYPAGDLRRLEGEGGYCTNKKLCEAWGPQVYEPDALVCPYCEGVEIFWTGAEFGCVHHEHVGKDAK